jgi:Rps23 Pro-64 3,4-dihydroxylase Tpa1-like proline 4-hydroxylase
MEQDIYVHYTPVFHIIIDNCFDDQLNLDIYNHILSLKDDFNAAGTGVDGKINKDYRTNYNCFIDRIYNNSRDVNTKRFSRHDSPLLKAIDRLIQSDRMKRILDTTPFPICKFREFDSVQIQVSRYGGESQFYTWHIDRMINSPNPDGRIVSIVYYFHKLPKSFSGGELCLTNGMSYAGKIVAQGQTVEIEPINNRLVIFSSRTVHSVKPTSSPPNFDDGRFSANIWTGFKRSSLTRY